MTNAQRHALSVRQFPRRAARSPKRRLGAMKVVAEFLDKTQEEDLMKYLLMIATLAAFISTATATSPRLIAARAMENVARASAVKSSCST